MKRSRTLTLDLNGSNSKPYTVVESSSIHLSRASYKTAHISSTRPILTTYRTTYRVMRIQIGYHANYSHTVGVIDPRLTVYCNRCIRKCLHRRKFSWSISFNLDRLLVKKTGSKRPGNFLLCKHPTIESLALFNTINTPTDILH